MFDQKLYDMLLLPSCSGLYSRTETDVGVSRFCETVI